jgi:PRTRC genetic system protein E
MFKELAPLLRHRAVLFTVTHVEEDQFRVNVIPKKVTDGESDALTTPVSVTGTVDDLDRELPQTLVNFVSSHLELKNTLERAKSEMDAASKAARTEVRKKSGNQVSRKDQADSPSPKPAPAPEIPAPVKSESPKAASLFDLPTDTPTSVASPVTAKASAEGPIEQSDLDEDDEILHESYTESEDEETDEAA